LATVVRTWAGHSLLGFYLCITYATRMHNLTLLHVIRVYWRPVRATWGYHHGLAIS